MKTKNKNGIFIFVFILWYATEILFNTTITENGGDTIEVLNSVVNYAVLGLLMVQILFFQQYKKRELVIIVIITVPIVISAARSGYFVLLSAWMFIVAAKNIDFDNIVHIAYKVLKVMVPLILLLFLMGILKDYTMYRNSVLRHSLGFSHPNQLGLRIFQIVACHFYVHRESLKMWNIIFAILLAIAVYIIPNSQTSVICMCILCIFVIFYFGLNKYNSSLMHTFIRILIIIGILCNLLSIVWSVWGIEGSEMINQIDQWLSMRFTSCHKVLQIYGSSLWGQRLYITSSERILVGIHTALYLDNAYMALLLRMGLITYVLFTIMYMRGMILIEKSKNNVLLIILVVYAIYGIMENGLYSLSHNIFLLAFSDILYRRNILDIGRT